MVEIKTNEPPKRRFWILVICTLLALGALMYGGYRVYAHWEPGYLAGKARQSIAKKDFAGAQLQLMRALQINSGNVMATRVAAELLEAVGSPEAVQWRSHVLDLTPNSTEDKLAWLAAAIRFNQPAAVDKAKSTFTATEKGTAGYEACTGALAASHGNFEESAKHYIEALRRDPNNISIQFDYAGMQLASPDWDVRRAGIDSMKHLGSDVRVSTAAHRALIHALAGNGSLKEALAESLPFQSSPDAGFEDRLTHLDILDRLANPEAAAYLVSLQGEAKKTPKTAGLLIGWMNGRGKSRAAIEWALTLPKAFGSIPQCAASIADCYVAVHDWTGLENLMNAVKWKEFEFLRLALLARAERENGKDDIYDVTWQSALTAAIGSSSSLGQLRQVVSTWGPAWKSQLNSIISALGKQWGDTNALQYLYVEYTKERDTSKLREVTGEIVKASPSNRNAINNFAIFSMLIKQDLTDAVNMARQLHETDSHNAAFASTYAYGLHLTGYSGQGLKIMESLDPDQLNEPAIAAYYGILLAANNKPDRATEFLRIAQKEGDPLPEEKALIETAFNRANLKLMPLMGPRESGSIN
ncbi:MAG: hypothetical protein WCD79_04665 [Chthoniobacteraceae bacterium]